jgi:hypothetical protein
VFAALHALPNVFVFAKYVCVLHRIGCLMGLLVMAAVCVFAALANAADAAAVCVFAALHALPINVLCMRSACVCCTAMAA